MIVSTVLTFRVQINWRRTLSKDTREPSGNSTVIIMLDMIQVLMTVTRCKQIRYRRKTEAVVSTFFVWNSHITGNRFLECCEKSISQQQDDVSKELNSSNHTFVAVFSFQLYWSKKNNVSTPICWSQKNVILSLNWRIKMRIVFLRQIDIFPFLEKNEDLIVTSVEIIRN